MVMKDFMLLLCGGFVLVSSWCLVMVLVVWFVVWWSRLDVVGCGFGCLGVGVFCLCGYW